MFYFFAQYAIGQAALDITPSRIIFNDKENIEVVSVTNLANDIAVYDASFVQYNMTEKGGFTELIDFNEPNSFADGFLTLSHKQLVLNAGETRELKINFDKRNQMEHIEFRSHLCFREVLHSQENYSDNESTSFKISPVYGFTIPVIIRNFNENPACEFSDYKIIKTEAGQWVLNFFIYRRGKASTYGDIIAEYVLPNGSSKNASTASGVAIYTNIDKRFFSLPLKAYENLQDWQNLKMKITYTDAEMTSNNSRIICECNFDFSLIDFE